MYITTVMDHCNHPRNARVIEDADGSGEAGKPPGRTASRKDNLGLKGDM